MPFLVPFLVSALAGGFAASIVQGLIKVAIAMGVGFVVYQGFDVLFQNVMNQVSINFANTNLTQILGLLKVDKAINVIASATTVRFTLKSTLGALKKFEVK